MTNISPHTLHGFAEKVVTKLARSQADDGRIRDHVDGTRIEPGEYAQTTFATASMRIADQTSDDSLWAAAMSALDLFFDTDVPAGHADEFSTFALQELLASDLDLPSDRRRKIEDFAAYRAGRRTEQGNNWLLLQALCRHRHSRLRDTLSARYILSLSRVWEGRDGLLADQPRRPRETRETPLVYHAKMAMCLTRLAADGVDIGRRADRALQTLAQLIRPDGEFGYYGRSENTLFGYACAIDAAIRRQRAYLSPPFWLADLEERLLYFIGEQFDPTVINVQPTTDPTYDPIDGYVKRGVYGAYAAMLFTGLPDRKFPASPPRWGPTLLNADATSHVDTIPFNHHFGRDINLTIATTGQLKITHGGPDPRYAGGVPVVLTADGDRVVSGVPSDYRSRATLPYLPRVDTESGSFSPVTWTPRDGPADFVGQAQFHKLPSDWGCSSDESETAGGRSEQPSRLRKLVRRLVSRTVVERAVIDKRKQPTQIPAELIRAIHAADGFVLIQDLLVVSPNNASTLTVTPASATVLQGFAGAVSRKTSDDRPPGRSLTSGSAHWGPTTWVTADARPVSDKLSIATLLDPLDKVCELLHPVESTSIGTTTRVLTASEEYEFDCPAPGVG